MDAKRETELLKIIPSCARVAGTLTLHWLPVVSMPTLTRYGVLLNAKATADAARHTGKFWRNPPPRSGV